MNPRGPVIWAESIAAAYRKELERHGGGIAVDGVALPDGRVQVTLTFTLPVTIVARLNVALDEA